MSTQGSTGARKGGPECTPLTCLPFCTPPPVPGGWDTRLIHCGTRGTQQQGELQNDRETGGQGAAVSETLSCRILAQRLLPLLAPAAAHRARSRSGASVTYRCPCATTQGDLPPLPRGPKPW